MNSVNLNKRKASESSNKSLLFPSQNDLQESYALAVESLEDSCENSPKSPSKSLISTHQSLDCSRLGTLYTGQSTECSRQALRLSMNILESSKETCLSKSDSCNSNERFSGISDLNDEQKIKHLVKEKDPDIFSKFSKDVKNILFGK